MQKPILSSIVISVMLISCAKEKRSKIQEVEFRANYFMNIDNIPKLDSGQSLTVYSEVSLTEESDSLIKYGIKAGDLLDVDLMQTDLFVQDFCNMSLSFLDSFAFYLVRESQEDLYLTSRSNISSTAGGIAWIINSEENLAEYLNTGSFKLRMDLISDEKTTETGFLYAIVRFKVKANVNN